MAHRTDDIQQDIEDTQRNMADTQSAMTEKLEMLGERVRETVEGAQASVEGMVGNVIDTVDTTVAAVKQTVEGAQASMEGMVENVRGTVGNTVEAVQRTFDLHHQMDQHPWLMLSGSLVVGYLLGSGGNGRAAAVGSTYEPRFSPPSPTPVSSSESPTRPQLQRGTESGDLDMVYRRNCRHQKRGCGGSGEHLVGHVQAGPAATNFPLHKHEDQAGKSVQRSACADSDYNRRDPDKRHYHLLAPGTGVSSQTCSQEREACVDESTQLNN